MARRASVVNQVRGDHENLLLLDCGDLFDHGKRYPRLRAETILKAMEKMGYDAMNVADSDLSLGGDFFNALTQKSTISRLSLTLKDKGSETAGPVYEPFLMKDFGRFKVAVIGITASRFFDDQKLAEAGMGIGKEQIESLKKLLPAVREKADIVILLAHMGRADTLDLFRSKGVRGIDVAIVGHASSVVMDPLQIGDTLVLQSGSKGEYMGQLHLTLGKKGKISAYENEMVFLTSDIPDTPWAAAMTKAFKKESLKRDKAERKAKQKKENEQRLKALVEERKKLLSLPPEEAVKRLPEFVKTRKLY